MGRMLEVKERLIDLKEGNNFVNLDDVLVDLKLTPEVLEVPVPKFFLEDQRHLLEEREKYLDVLLKEAGIVKQRVLELANELGTVVEQSNRGCVVLAWPLTGGGN